MTMKLKILTCWLMILVLIISCNPVQCEDEEGQEDFDEDDEFDDVPAVPEGMSRENMMKWSAPDLNDEEAHSTRLPSNLKCDGCTAIAFQLSVLIQAFHTSKFAKKGKKAPESDIIDLVEKICDKQVFDSYGVKPMHGVNRLSGPGLEAAEEPGMMQGGGRWPHRLSMMCGEIVGEADEYEIYEYILEHGPEELFSFLCENPDNDTLNSCGGHKPKDEL
ncbi:marginal zone B- and B1-cell-specific protein-like [Watersipora subatra]|uniref:marginal zone B- and B1-cell-specific protein-like n=1 Tax=Watersipora subatra TaxID=2589382 RepID=UPI00355AE214